MSDNLAPSGGGQFFQTPKLNYIKYFKLERLRWFFFQKKNCAKSRYFQLNLTFFTWLRNNLPKHSSEKKMQKENYLLH